MVALETKAKVQCLKKKELVDQDGRGSQPHFILYSMFLEALIFYLNISLSSIKIAQKLKVIVFFTLISHYTVIPKVLRNEFVGHQFNRNRHHSMEPLYSRLI